jgi:hypothetical protein
MMSDKYPFGFDWTGYTNYELIDMAHTSMKDFDRQDMKAFIEVMAGRLEHFVMKEKGNERKITNQRA